MLHLLALCPAMPIDSRVLSLPAHCCTHKGSKLATPCNHSTRLRRGRRVQVNADLRSSAYFQIASLRFDAWIVPAHCKDVANPLCPLQNLMVETGSNIRDRQALGFREFRVRVSCGRQPVEPRKLPDNNLM